MIDHVLLRLAWKCCAMLFLVAMLMPQQRAYGQGLELGGGWAHMTGNNGTNGYEVGAAWWFNRRVTLAANYDSAWDTSSLSTFAVSGLVTTHSHLQDLLFGPRIFFSSQWTDRHKLRPFGEAEFGVSWLGQSVAANLPGFSGASASGNGFSWMLGGGAEYLIDPHWSARANLDFLRNHLADQGQSHVRLVLGLTYTLGKRGPG